jgi:hypothetical protein
MRSEGGKSSTRPQISEQKQEDKQQLHNNSMALTISSVKNYFLRSNGGSPPALTAGLSVFLVFLHILDFALDLNKAIALHADSLFKLDRELSSLELPPPLMVYEN